MEKWISNTLKSLAKRKFYAFFPKMCEAVQCIDILMYF